MIDLGWYESHALQNSLNRDKGEVMKLEDIKKVQEALTPDDIEVADKLRAIALDIKEVVVDVKRLKPTGFYDVALKGIAVSLYEFADALEGVVEE